MTLPRLEMRDIRKQFPGTVANDGAQLTVMPGEVHGLVGENGAGKSTLMKILAGVYQPDSGEIRLDGETVHIAHPLAGIEAGISVIYQELDLVPDMTVAQNLFLGRKGINGALVHHHSRNAAARQVIDRVGGTFETFRLVRDLPVAQQQLTAIAKAITIGARIIVMDEPSATLTEHELPAVFTLVRSLAAEGRSVVYISHRLDEVMEVGDRATVLRDGKTVAELMLPEVTQDDLVTAMIGHRVTTTPRAQRRFDHGAPTLDIRHIRIPNVIDVTDIAVRAGEIVGLAGLGGAGRTTLLSAIFGAVPADSDMSLGGDSFAPKRPGAAVGCGVGLVPEDRKVQGLLQELSVVRNAGLAALPRWGMRPRATARAMTHEPLRDLGVKYANLDQAVGQLSGGNQQKVVLAKWLTRGIRVLLLDEPTRGIDVGAKEELFRRVHALADTGVAILMASSELTELMRNADHIWVMHEGRNVAVFDPRVTPEDKIARAVVTGKVEDR